MNHKKCGENIAGSESTILESYQFNHLFPGSLVRPLQEAHFLRQRPDISCNHTLYKSKFRSETLRTEISACPEGFVVAGGKASAGGMSRDIEKSPKSSVSQFTLPKNHAMMFSGSRSPVPGLSVRRKFAARGGGRAALQLLQKSCNAT